MPTITTKSQIKTRATKPSDEEVTQAQGQASGQGSSPESSSSSPSGSSSGWSFDSKSGHFSGPGGKHYGDTIPKVAVGSKAEAEGLVKECDPTAKIAGSKVTSQLDTMPTYIVEVAGRFIISGPLARNVAQSRGLIELTAGDGNPSVAPATETGNETGSSGDDNAASSVGDK